MRQAQRFWDVAEASNDPEHANQAASNAIHAVIAANDAVCLFLVHERPGGKSHSEAATLLRQACKGTRWEREAAAKARQYAQITQMKNAAEYEGQLLSTQDVDRIMTQARRFIDWAERVVSR
ncbi:MAG: HEPN domain-containing protein [Armatimonadota bacterium]